MGVAEPYWFVVSMSSRHQVLPLVGSSDVTDFGVQTINWHWPPALITSGEA